MDFASFTVSSLCHVWLSVITLFTLWDTQLPKQVENWRFVANKFQKHVKARKNLIKPDTRFNMLSSRQLNALLTG
jgi:hypothetical protein